MSDKKQMADAWSRTRRLCTLLARTLPEGRQRDLVVGQIGMATMALGVVAATETDEEWAQVRVVLGRAEDLALKVGADGQNEMTRRLKEIADGNAG